MRSYQPDDLFDERGRLKPELHALAPQGDKPMGASPYANGGLLRRELNTPDIRVAAGAGHRAAWPLDQFIGNHLCATAAASAG